MGSMHSTDCALHVRNLVKRYGNGQPTLNKLDMTVSKGTIYSMLGASGCGKTTLLSCVVGLQSWDSGEILVLGKSPGKYPATMLGYMPQDLSLYNQLSIFEIVQFYGKLYHISEYLLQERWTLLKVLLQFPEKLELIRNMSGGQQRRASLALALIHSPDLLILDEPTVGLDPLLRQKIWIHLRTLVDTQNTTIIITTHYIEEARLSDMIGVIRNGRIISECSPAHLLEKYISDRLEDAVTKLCRDDENQLAKRAAGTLDENDCKFLWKKVVQNSSSSTTNTTECILLGARKSANSECEIHEKRDEKQSIKSVRDLFGSECTSMHRVQFIEKIRGYTIVLALTLMRNPLFLVALMIIPTIQLYVSIAAVGARVKDIHFGVVNHDLVNWQTDCEHPNNVRKTCDSLSISCLFLNKIQEENLLTLESYGNETTATQQVRMGRIWGYILIPANYSTHLMDLGMQKHYSSNETLDGSRILLQLDHSQYLTAFFVKKELYLSYAYYLKQLTGLCGMSKGEFALPFHFRTAVYGDYSDNYADFMFPGVILITLYSMTTGLTSLLFVEDYKQGTLSRARVAGLSILHIISSHILFQSVITLGQIAIVTGFQYFALGIEIRGYQLQFLYFVICFLTGIFSTPFGLLVGILFRDEAESLVFHLFNIPLLLCWAGVCFPTETTPWLLRQILYIVPIKSPIMSLRSAFVRDLGITHALVWPGILVSVAWVFILSFACIIAFKALKL